MHWLWFYFRARWRRVTKEKWRWKYCMWSMLWWSLSTPVPYLRRTLLWRFQPRDITKALHNHMTSWEERLLPAVQIFVQKAGFYEIIKLPFYADGIIEAHLFDSAINRLGDLPQDLDEDDLHYSLYFVCEDCVKKMLESNHPRSTSSNQEGGGS